MPSRPCAMNALLVLSISVCLFGGDLWSEAEGDALTTWVHFSCFSIEVRHVLCRVLYSSSSKNSFPFAVGSIANIMTARAPLARLQPFRPACAQPFHRHQPLSLIDRIEIEDTVEREGVTYYVITVTMRAIPSSTKAISCTQATPTVYRVERRFREFAAFRQQLTVTVENLHPGYCGYCNRLIRFLSHSLEQPGRLVQLTTGVKQRKRILARFLNQALRIFTTELLGIARRCEGRKIFQSMLRRFLRQHDPSSTHILTSR